MTGRIHFLSCYDCTNGPKCMAQDKCELGHELIPSSHGALQVLKPPILLWRDGRDFCYQSPDTGDVYYYIAGDVEPSSA